MAAVITESYTCDRLTKGSACGKPAERVKVQIPGVRQGKPFLVDLCKTHTKSMQRAMAPLVALGGGSSTTVMTNSEAGEPTITEIPAGMSAGSKDARLWLESAGMLKDGSRGRIAGALLEFYALHSTEDPAEHKKIVEEAAVAS